MNILLVSSYLPYPLFSGGNNRLYNLLKNLGKKHTITLVCEIRTNQTSADIAEVKKFCKEVYVVQRQKQWSFKNIVKTGFSLDPFLIVGHTNSEMNERIKNLLAKHSYDLIHAETFYILQNVPETTIPIVLVEHNIEYLVYKRYAEKAFFPMRPLLYIDVLKLKQKEKQAWKRATKLVSVSEDEKKLMGNPTVSIVPNGVDTHQFEFREHERKQYRSIAKGMSLPEKELLFIGDFKWIQNRDSAKWIIQDIWPYLLRAVDGEVKIKLRIVGRNIPEQIKKLNMYDSVIFDENSTKETALIFQQADILLTPIRVGGGTSYKILEAMATGTPVVTTSLGGEGFGVEDEKNIIIADDVQTIVEKTAALLRNQELYSSIAEHARKLIEEKYDWKKIASALDTIYQSVSNR